MLLNLTEEQRNLLVTIVQQYDNGRKGEFLFNVHMQGAEIIYLDGGGGFHTEADDSDFKQLAHQDLITLGTRGGNLVGKPTQLGIDLVHRGDLDKVVSKSVSRIVNRQHGRVFIGHGHSHVWKDLRDFLETKLNLDVDDFNREPTAGLSTTEVLQQKLEDATFAFLVMTGEDPIGDDGMLRTRENVVHEIGLFQGRLGLRRAIILQEEGCSAFSNIHGLTVIPFPKNNVLAVSEKIREVLQREQII